MSYKDFILMYQNAYKKQAGDIKSDKNISAIPDSQENIDSTEFEDSYSIVNNKMHRRLNSQA